VTDIKLLLLTGNWH